MFRTNTTANKISPSNSTKDVAKYDATVAFKDVMALRISYLYISLYSLCYLRFIFLLTNHFDNICMRFFIRVLCHANVYKEILKYYIAREKKHTKKKINLTTKKVS